MPLAQKNQFEGIGRLNRAWLYYQLVREYGDIQWEDRVINNPDDPIVYGERTSRDQVMDYVLQDSILPLLISLQLPVSLAGARKWRWL